MVNNRSSFAGVTSAFGTWSEAHSSFKKIDRPMACKTPNLLKHRFSVLFAIWHFGGVVVPSSFL